MVAIGGGRPFITIFIFGFVFMMLYGLVSDYQFESGVLKESEALERISATGDLASDIESVDSVDVGSGDSSEFIENLRGIGGGGEKAGKKKIFSFMWRTAWFMFDAVWRVSTADFIPTEEEPAGPWPIGWAWIGTVMKVPIWLVSGMFLFSVVYLCVKALPFT